MRLGKVKEALAMFPDSVDFKVDYIPEVYEFSHTPKHPSTLYILVELDYQPEESVQKRLRELGWHSEDNEGYNWLLYF